MKIVPLISLTVLLVPLLVQADDVKGNHAVWGIGQSSCNGYNNARQAGQFTDYKAYMMGYLTAYNTHTPETYSITADKDLNGVLGWLDDYCKKSVVDSFENALRQLVQSSYDTRSKRANNGGAAWSQMPKQSPSQ